MALDDEDLERLYAYVFGNGHPGLDEQVRSNTMAIETMHTDLTDIKASLKTLVQDRRDEIARREGSRSTLNWIRFGLITLVLLISIGGSIGLWQTTQRWEQVQQQLQRIPALPE